MTGQKLDSYLQLPKGIFVLIFSLLYNLSFRFLWTSKIASHFSPFHFHESSHKLISLKLIEILSFSLHQQQLTACLLNDCWVCYCCVGWIKIKTEKIVEQLSSSASEAWFWVKLKLSDVSFPNSKLLKTEIITKICNANLEYFYFHVRNCLKYFCE